MIGADQSAPPTDLSNGTAATATATGPAGPAATTPPTSTPLTGPIDPAQAYQSPQYDANPFVFGRMLGDGIKLVSKQIEEGNKYMSEMRAFMATWAAQERQHANALLETTRAFRERTAKIAGSLSHGAFASPSAVIDLDPLSSGMGAWIAQLQSMEEDCASRINAADVLTNKVCSQLHRAIELKENLRKQYVSLEGKLQESYKTSQSDLKKAQEHYNAACSVISKRKNDFTREEIESTAVTAPKSSRLRAMVSYWAAKNKYLLTVSSATSASDSFYKLDIPWLLNEMESLERSRTVDIQYVISTMCGLRNNLAASATQRSSDLTARLEKVSPSNDAMLFAMANKTDAFVPKEIRFESPSQWRESSDIMRAGVAAVMLRNFRQKICDRISRRVYEANKHQEKLDVVRRIQALQLVTYDPVKIYEIAPRAVELAVDGILLHTELRRNCAILSVLSDAVGGASANDRHHQFVRSSSKNMKACAYCESSLFKFSGSVLVCRLCNAGCHIECELKVAPNCSKASEHSAGAGMHDGTESICSYATTGRSDFDLHVPFNDTASVLSSDTHDLHSRPDSNGYRNSDLNGGMAFDDSAMSSSTDVQFADSDVPPPPPLQASSNVPPPPSLGFLQGSSSSPAGAVENRGSDIPAAPPLAAPAFSATDVFYAWVEYEYASVNDGELSVPAHRVVRVADWDSPGAGWVQVEYGPPGAPDGSGIVPSSYVRDITKLVASHGAQNLVTMQFAFESDNISVSEGQLLIVQGAPEGGWLPVASEDGAISGDVPESYVAPIIMDTAPNGAS